eukprot:757729-Hanusia_phi.AAC.2
MASTVTPLGSRRLTHCEHRRDPWQWPVSAFWEFRSAVLKSTRFKGYCSTIAGGNPRPRALAGSSFNAMIIRSRQRYSTLFVRRAALTEPLNCGTAAASAGGDGAMITPGRPRTSSTRRCSNRHPIQKNVMRAGQPPVAADSRSPAGDDSDSLTPAAGRGRVCARAACPGRSE